MCPLGALRVVGTARKSPAVTVSEGQCWAWLPPTVMEDFLEVPQSPHLVSKKIRFLLGGSVSGERCLSLSPPVTAVQMATHSILHSVGASRGGGVMPLIEAVIQASSVIDFVFEYSCPDFVLRSAFWFLMYDN